MNNYHKEFLLFVGIISGTAMAAVNGYFFIDAGESAVFIILFMIPVSIICYAGAFIGAEMVWKIGIKSGLIKEKKGE